MTDTTAAFYDVRTCNARVTRGDHRRTAHCVRTIGGTAITGLLAVATVGISIAAVTLAATWLVGVSLSSHSQLQTRASHGPATLALAPGAAPQASFEAQWARSTGAVHIVAVPQQAIHLARDVVPPAAPNIVAQRATPLPRSRPMNAPSVQTPVDVAQAPAAPVVPQVALVAALVAAPVAAVAAAPAALPPAAPAEKRVAPQVAHNKSLKLPDPDSRTAVYDISARTVYMPNGKKLEAHSGLGDKMDDPRHIKVRMRGPTPPNVYDLTLREKLFHGVRAIRLNPVDGDKMYGRDGMLAHSYMLGPNGQSNGCVSFKNYDAFLEAYLNGEVERLVVVPHLGDAPPALIARTRRAPDRRYAATDLAAMPRDSSW